MRATLVILVAALSLIALALIATAVRGQVLPEVRPFVLAAGLVLHLR